jgi:hypothetical protein
MRPAAFLIVSACAALPVFIGSAHAQVTISPPSMATPAPPLSPAPGWYVAPSQKGPAQPLTRNPTVQPPYVGGPLLSPFKAPSTVIAPPSTGPMPPITNNPAVTGPSSPGPIPAGPPAGW